jgi:predicted MFS family arabinose efflux permease
LNGYSIGDISNQSVHNGADARRLPLRDRSVEMSINVSPRAASAAETPGLPTIHADTPAATVLTAAVPATWYAPLYYLALGAFAVGTEGFMIAAILPRIAEDLSVSWQAAGQLVTIFTLVYAVSSPILTALTGGVHRRKLLLATMGLFTLGNLIAASAPGYWSLVLARILIALAAGLYGPNANALAGALVPTERRGRALAIVNGGISLAVALGVPLGALIGSHFGWRMTFIGVAVLAATALVGLHLGIPKEAATGLSAATLRERVAVIGQPAVLPALFVTTLWGVGGYTVYTYIAPFLATVIDIEGTQIGYVLFCWGAAAFTGLFIGGVINDKIGAHRAIIIALPLMAIALASLSVSAAYATPARALLPVIAAVAVWGITAWGFFPPQQSTLDRHRRPEECADHPLPQRLIHVSRVLARRGAGLGHARVEGCHRPRLGRRKLRRRVPPPFSLNRSARRAPA